MLPLTNKTANSPPPSHLPVTGTGRILIVDDEKVMRISAQGLLENLGYETFLAKDGREAIELYRSHWETIDLVLLDMVMPKMNGKDCFRRLKQINPAVKVLLTSGYSSEADIVEMQQEGLNGFINKPYRTMELSKTVSSILTFQAEGALLFEGNIPAPGLAHTE